MKIFKLKLVYVLVLVLKSKALYLQSSSMLELVTQTKARCIYFNNTQELLGRIDLMPVEFLTESIRKLSNFNFQWTKTLYQNILGHIAFFFTLFKGYRCN